MDDAIMKIKSPSSTFEDVVSDPIVIRLYRSQNSYVQKYFKSHSIELLKYTLSSGNTAAENNSFMITMSGDPDILTPILKSDKDTTKKYTVDLLF